MFGKLELKTPVVVTMHPTAKGKMLASSPAKKKALVTSEYFSGRKNKKLKHI